MAEYDAAILEQFADRLYARANRVIGVYAFVGLTLGAIPAALLGPGPPNARLWFIVIGALIGWEAGRQKAFYLKLDAQRTLCQLQIEKNTRR